MSTEFFIARRIYKGDKKNNKRVSSPAIKIAIAGIALGLAVMLVSVCIIVGFKKEIREKVKIDYLEKTNIVLSTYLVKSSNKTGRIFNE